ncbi:hypothetical protein LLE49_02050 [Alicyclobacillus tolerans]|uniref:hypothetical protein n=1 Tax=Alicyclobacillus tolerans TaxID=90970 RepID=UPI001F38651F|nr:hypothetical protein [Alicyclobacillus tolerans]MCF8563519.1 hypothetical protein [Alicyclobacillus tolerans]
MNKGQAMKAWKRAESSARHGVVVFLIIYSLIGIDIMSYKTEEERRKVTATWLGWGIPFLLLAFFIITPEQEAIQMYRELRD